MAERPILCELDTNIATVKTVDADGKVVYWCSTCYKELQRDIRECGINPHFRNIHFAGKFLETIP